MPLWPKLEPARIEWQNDMPFAADYGDVYFAREGGLEEARHVFLAGNGLPERFRTCSAFTIAETGFGTGLNFLAAWQAFEKHSNASSILHYVAFEKHPLTLAALRQARAMFPELQAFAKRLQNVYPWPLPGFHRLAFLQEKGLRVSLTLMFGEANDLLPHAHFLANAWFLDGFAPAKNASLWQNSLFAEIYRLSAPQATLATFTVAGSVQRGLREVGFRVEKTPGFGRKREMLRGELP